MIFQAPPPPESATKAEDNKTAESAKAEEKVEEPPVESAKAEEKEREEVDEEQTAGPTASSPALPEDKTTAES